MIRKCVLLYQDNVPVHIPVVTVEAVHERVFESIQKTLIIHVASYDSIKQCLSVIHFRSDYDVILLKTGE